MVSKARKVRFTSPMASATMSPTGGMRQPSECPIQDTAPSTVTHCGCPQYLQELPPSLEAAPEKGQEVLSFRVASLEATLKKGLRVSH